MKKLKNKLKLFEIMFFLLLKTVQFRVKVFLRKISNGIDFSLRKIIFFTVCLIVFFIFFHLFFLSAPADFPIRVIINVEQGENLRDVSFQFKENNIIRSRLIFEAFVILYGGEKHVIPADYYFENKLPVFEVAKRISKGERHLAPVKVIIPEGLNLLEMAQVFIIKLPNFSQEKFLQTAKDLEGYLFPDTYFFFTTDGEQEVIKLMGENFNKKIKLLRPLIVKAGKTEKEIIIMASLIEGEAKGDMDRGFISGILWKRLSKGMPLQVDVALETYKTKGLPKSPIGNPGLAAIEAAIYPQNSPYLYYLHDKNGDIHYAKNLLEHTKNILRYLK